MKSQTMYNWEQLVNKIDTDNYHVYYSKVQKMEFPAIILTPNIQTGFRDLANYANYNTEYIWTLVILFKIEDYTIEGQEDKLIYAMDDAWLLAETIPGLLGVKIVESSPFLHIQENKEIFCIEFKVLSRKIKSN